MHGYVRLCTAMHDYERPVCRAMHGYAGVCTAMQGYVRLCAAMQVALFHCYLRVQFFDHPPTAFFKSLQRDLLASPLHFVCADVDNPHLSSRPPSDVGKPLKTSKGGKNLVLIHKIEAHSPTFLFFFSVIFRENMFSLEAITMSSFRASKPLYGAFVAYGCALKFHYFIYNKFYYE